MKKISLLLISLLTLSLIACSGGSSIGSASNENVAQTETTKSPSLCKMEGCYQTSFQDGYCKDHYLAKGVSNFFGIN